MTSEQMLAILKLNLSLATTAYDDYLSQLLTAAAELITREGITLTDSTEDSQLQIMYAAYLFRKRAEDNPPMPRMLRWALNNRLFSEKVSGTT